MTIDSLPAGNYTLRIDVENDGYIEILSDERSSTIGRRKLCFNIIYSIDALKICATIEYHDDNNYCRIVSISLFDRIYVHNIMRDKLTP